MIEKFFTQPKTLSRLHAGLLGPYLPAVAEALDQARYSTASIRLHLRAADHFGAWLREQKVALSDVGNATIDHYLQGLGRQPSAGISGARLPNAALGLRHLVEVLRRRGVLKPAAEGSLSSAGEWIANFDRHLDRTVGCSSGSRDNYIRYARRFLQDLFQDAEVDWSRVGAATVTDFVRREVAKLRPSACGQPVTAIRSLIRFLASQGAVSDGLLGAVPAVRTWRHSSIPRTISIEQVEQVIAACDTESNYGLRERAIVLAVARLGLRGGEVIRLRIDDIDWVRGCVLVRAGKTHRERSLPLSQELGDALASYLRKARPVSDHRELFLRWRPPFHPLSSSVSICALIQKLLKRAGITVHRPGAHVFRHSLATGMAINGVTFKTIADVLGHQSLATTEIYAKLDLWLTV